MKKIILTSIFLFASVFSVVKASPFDFYAMQRNSLDTGNMITLVPSSGVNTIVGLKGSTKLAVPYYFGTHLSVDGSGNINVDLTGQSQSNITNLVSDLAAKFILPGSGTTSQYLDGTGALQTAKTLLSQFTNDPGFITSVPAQSFASLTGKPTTLSGYGITDAYPLTGNPSGFLTSSSTIPYTSLSGTPSIPTLLSQLTNDTGFITSAAIAGKVDTTTTVNGHALSSNVIVTKSDVSLGNADNTSDANKPVSTATQTALNLKADTSSLGTAAAQNSTAFATAAQGTKADTALQNVTGLVTAGTGTTVTGSGTSGAPYVVNASNAGTVTSIICGTGLTGGTITSTGTCAAIARSWNNTPGRSIVTGTGATGFQVSSTRDSSINYSVTVSTTATIGTPSAGSISLEIASTNSATPSDWLPIGAVCGNSQNITLAALLSSVQAVTCQISTNLPAGWYVKIRSVTVSGSPIYTYLSGQEMLF